MAMLFTLKPDSGNSSSLITNSALNETGESKRTFQELLSGILKLTDLKTAQGIRKNNSNSEFGPVDKGLKAGTPLAELKKLLEDLGLPLNSVFLNPAGLPHMVKILSDSGFDQLSIKRFLDQTRQEPLSLERMLALLGTAPGNYQAKSTLPETSLPLFSRFFQELGLAPEQVKDMVSDLTKGSGFDAEILRTLFQKHGHTNLKELNMTGVDQTNLREIFTEIGARSEDVRAVFSQLQKTEGKMSVEEFLTSLKTLTEPEVLKPNQIAHLGAIIQNLRFNDSLRSQPRFNRILSLIQSLGNGREDPDLLRNSPAVAVLRQGTVSASALVNGSGFGTETENQTAGQTPSLDQQSVERFLNQMSLGPQSQERMLAWLETALRNSQATLTLPKELNMAGLDQINLRELLTELGARSEDVQALFSQLQKTEGKMSVEEFLTSLKVLTGPEALKPNQIAHLGTIIQNLRLKNSLRSQPRFNRILSLIQSLGNEKEDLNFLRSNPAEAVLRQGMVSDRALANSNGFSAEIGNQLVGQTASGGIASVVEKLATEPWPDPRPGLNRPQQLAESVLKQVAEKLVQSSLNNRHWIRIQLEPKELGQLKINLIYNNNNLSARIVTESGFVKDALDNQWQQLSKTLSQQGINLERFEVSLDSGQAGLSKRSEDWGEPRRNRQSVANTGPSSDSQPLEEVHSSLSEAVLSNTQVDLII